MYYLHVCKMQTRDWLLDNTQAWHRIPTPSEFLGRSVTSAATSAAPTVAAAAVPAAAASVQEPPRTIAELAVHNGTALLTEIENPAEQLLASTLKMSLEKQDAIAAVGSQLKPVVDAAINYQELVVKTLHQEKLVQLANQTWHANLTSLVNAVGPEKAEEIQRHYESLQSQRLRHQVLTSNTPCAQIVAMCNEGEQKDLRKCFPSFISKTTPGQKRTKYARGVYNTYWLL